MTTKILVSACLLGHPVRYDGNALELENDTLTAWKAAGMLVPLCPEIAAGFQIPRPPAEIEAGKTADDVRQGDARINEDNGWDVTEAFVLGAQIAVEVALKNGCQFALLTDGSPSCGSTYIYSGNHDGVMRAGSGVVTSALREHGINVYSQNEIETLANCLDLQRSQKDNRL